MTHLLHDGAAADADGDEECVAGTEAFAVAVDGHGIDHDFPNVN